MTRKLIRYTDSRIVLLVAALVVACSLASPALAQCEDQEVKIELLTRQIEAMQKQILTLQELQKLDKNQGTARPAPVASTAAPAPTAAADAAAKQRAAAARGEGRAEAMALYDRIDQLLGESQIDEAKQALADFNATNQGTPAASWTRSLTREMTAVGKPAPDDWSIERWLQGESDVDLDGGAPTVVVFWESWCPHCRTEVPKMQAIYDKYRGDGLQVVGVTRLTRTATEETVESFISEQRVSYPIAKESGALAEYFAVKGIPAAAVVKDGQIVWRGHPMRLKAELLESWM
jgi:thiol-disulfide isomerase/thioredoxin